MQNNLDLICIIMNINEKREKSRKSVINSELLMSLIRHPDYESLIALNMILDSYSSIIFHSTVNVVENY